MPVSVRVVRAINRLNFLFSFAVGDRNLVLAEGTQL